MPEETDFTIADANFSKSCKDGFELFMVKNRKYGNAISRTGVLGAVVEIIGATARLPQLVLKSPDHGRSVKEKLRDILLDIHNYASIAIFMIETDNWEGED